MKYFPRYMRGTLSICLLVLASIAFAFSPVIDRILVELEKFKPDAAIDRPGKPTNEGVYSIVASNITHRMRMFPVLMRRMLSFRSHDKPNLALC